MPEQTRWIKLDDNNYDYSVGVGARRRVVGVVTQQPEGRYVVQYFPTGVFSGIEPDKDFASLSEAKKDVEQWYKQQT